MEMDFVNKLFNGKGYIEGITIINVEGEILFSAKFNNKLDSREENYEVVGKKFLDIYENLDENTSSVYVAMRKGVPVYIENQPLKSAGLEPIEITSLSTLLNREDGCRRHRFVCIHRRTETRRRCGNHGRSTLFL